MGNNPLGARKKLTESQFGFLLAIPAIAVFCFIILYPLVNSIIMSFTNQSLLTKTREFVGLKNYITVFSDPNMTQVFTNTLIFVIATTLLSFLLGLIWATILSQGFRGSEFMRGVTLVNWIIPGTAIGFLWMWIFNGQYGVINSLLKNIGLIDSNIIWMGKPATAMITVIFARSWQILPWNMAFLLAGIIGIPKEQIEAAKIDGAGNMQIFLRVILPGMKFIIFMVLILGFIGNLQHFDIIWVMTQGGPGRSTATLAIEIYRTAFQSWNIGKASSIGVIWVILISIFAFFYLRSFREDA
jgi:multiple sugar transport system permease protein